MENELLFKPQLLADAERKKGKLQLYLKGQLNLNPSTVLTKTPCRFVMNPKVNIFMILELTSKASKMLVNRGKRIPSDYILYRYFNLYVYMQGTLILCL